MAFCCYAYIILGAAQITSKSKLATHFSHLMKPPQVLFGAIEAGGTKFVCAVGSGPDDIRAQERFDTTLPAETIVRCLAFLQRFDGLAAVGIAAFGPLDLQATSSTYGFITSTPKAGWRNTNLAGHRVHAAPRCTASDKSTQQTAGAIHLQPQPQKHCTDHRKHLGWWNLHQ